jgi:hypothetical protein
MDRQEILNMFGKQVNIINAQIVNGDYQEAVKSGKLLATWLSVKLNEKESVNEGV